MRRVLLLVLLLLALGVVTSYAVAWFGASLPRPLGGSNTVDPLVETEEGTHETWRLQEARSRLVTVRVAFDWGAFYDDSWTLSPPAHSVLHSNPEVDHEEAIVEREAGWPVRCARCWQHWRTGALPAEGVSGGALIVPVEIGASNTPSKSFWAPTARLVAGRESVLPLQPIWRGLALNALFFAALWGVLPGGAILLGALRRWRRARRGRCQRCGYDTQGSDSARCTECGLERDQRPRRVGWFPVVFTLFVLLVSAASVAGFGLHRVRAVVPVPAIHRAAATGDLEGLKAQLTLGVPPDSPMPAGVTGWDRGSSTATPLSFAVAGSEEDACAVLVRAGADPMSGGVAGTGFPLWAAMRNRDAEVIEVLIEGVPQGALGDWAFADVALDSEPATCLLILSAFEWPEGVIAYKARESVESDRYPSWLKDPGCVEFMLDHGLQIDSLLMRTWAERHAMDVLDLLDRRGIRAEGEIGIDAIWAACYNHNKVMLERLMELGARIEPISTQPWASVVLRERLVDADPEEFNLLLHAGLELYAVDPIGEGLLHGARDLDSNPGLFQHLIDLGLNVDLQSNNGKTPLMHAVQFGTADQVQMLLEAGADPTITDDDGYTAGDYACGGLDYDDGVVIRPCRGNEEAAELIHQWSEAPEPTDAVGTN